MNEYYSCIGEEAQFLFVGKPKVNLTIRINKNDEVIVHGSKQNKPDANQKECCHVSKDFFEKNFKKQDSWIELDTKPTLENNLKIFKTANDTVKILMLDFAKIQNQGLMTGRKFNKYIAKIRKEIDILNVIKPTLKHLKRDQKIVDYFKDVDIS